MKHKLILVLALGSILNTSFAACDLNVYLPNIEAQTREYQQHFLRELEKKGYQEVKFVDSPLDRQATYLMEFDSYGVFRIGQKAQVVIIDQEDDILHSAKKRTFGGNYFKHFKKLIKKVPECKVLTKRKFL